ncbi:MAG TPA: hypothetical protein VH396_19435 [Chitinophagaceae bacterium]|jgi:hypothetical protein
MEQVLKTGNLVKFLYRFDLIHSTNLQISNCNVVQVKVLGISTGVAAAPIVSL